MRIKEGLKILSDPKFSIILIQNHVYINMFNEVDCSYMLLHERLYHCKYTSLILCSIFDK